MVSKLNKFPDPRGLYNFTGAISFSSSYLNKLAWCLVHIRCLICICWVLSEFDFIERIQFDFCLLRNLYAGQEATVRTVPGTIDWFQIGKGVHQGCMLSPCLFNLYAEYIMRNARMNEAQARIKIAARNINNLKYADDNALMAESEEELKSLLMKVKEESEKV